MPDYDPNNPLDMERIRRIIGERFTQTTQQRSNQDRPDRIPRWIPFTILIVLVLIYSKVDLLALFGGALHCTIRLIGFGLLGYAIYLMVFRRKKE